MKLENTVENKAKFFAQYWGQNVRNEKLLKVNGFCKVLLSKEFLILRPISKISDEDAIELMRIKIDSKGGGDEIKSIEIESKTSDGFTFIVKYRNWGDDRQGFVFNGHTNPLSFYDYLRSKSYALPWMGLSVEDLIGYRWIKIEE